MHSEKLIKVGNISNLSDARYCAGMGAEMLGFAVVESTSGYLNPKTFQEIRGWISGPKIVAEIYGLQDIKSIQTIISDYAPDYFELSFKEYEQFGKDLPLTCIINAVSSKSALNIKAAYHNIAYIILENPMADGFDSYPDNIPLLVNINNKEYLSAAFQHTQVKGFVLNGSAEIRPGFKNYDHLADIFEALEEIQQ